MTEKQLLKMIDNMQWDLNRMPIGRAKEIAEQLDAIKEYVKENTVVKPTP